MNHAFEIDVLSVDHPGYDIAPNGSRTDRGNPMISVVEWFAPIRNAAWVAACFGSLGE